MTQTYHYVRLSPTVLIRVRSCYGIHRPDNGTEKCLLCAVVKQCAKRQKTEER